jgi:hypothetical protein
MLQESINESINSIDTSLTKITVRKDGVIEIRFKIDTYEVDIKDQLEIQDAFIKLTDNGCTPYYILVIPGKYGGITKEAREMEMFESNSFKNQLSQSIVVNNTSQRLLGSMYIALQKKKPTFPCKLFKTEELAMKWILNIKKQKSSITV